MNQLNGVIPVFDLLRPRVDKDTRLIQKLRSDVEKGKPVTSLKADLLGEEYTGHAGEVREGDIEDYSVCLCCQRVGLEEKAYNNTGLCLHHLGGQGTWRR